MIVIRVAAILVISTVLAGDAAAWQQSILEAQPEAFQTQTTTEASPQTPSPVLDRRDRIFYPGDTERLKPLGRKLMLNILLDQEEIFTSPFHMNRHNAWEWLLAGAATGGLIAADRHIADSFEQVKWAGHISNIGASYTLIPLVAGYYGYGVWKDHAKAREIGVLGTESLLDSLIVAGGFWGGSRGDRSEGEKTGGFLGGGNPHPPLRALAI